MPAQSATLLAVMRAAQVMRVAPVMRVAQVMRARLAIASGGCFVVTVSGSSCDVHAGIMATRRDRCVKLR